MTNEFIFNTVFRISRTHSPSLADGVRNRNSLIYKAILQQTASMIKLNGFFIIIIIQTVYTDKYKEDGIYKTVL